MTTPPFCKFFWILTALAGCFSFSTSSADEKPVNVIYILADDLGYGDLGCYGQELFETPHIDKLAEDGMLFTRHYSGSTVCAPSRSVLMTGQDTGHTPIRGNFEIQPEGQAPLPGDVFTLAEMFQKSGYATEAFGKWGLGCPGSEGDSTFTTRSGNTTADIFMSTNSADIWGRLDDVNVELF